MDRGCDGRSVGYDGRVVRLLAYISVTRKPRRGCPVPLLHFLLFSQGTRL